jgi:hypothetical protein
VGIGNAIVEVVGHIFSEVIVGTIGEGIEAIADKVRGTVKKRLPRLALSPPGASEADPRMQQLFTDALVAAAHLDDARLDQAERTIIARGLRSLGALAPAGAVAAGTEDDASAPFSPLLDRAQTRLKTEDPWDIIEGALRDADPRNKETLAGAVAAVALAGTSDRARLTKVFARIKDGAQLDDKAWDTIMSEARVRVRLVKGKSASDPAGDPAGKSRSRR